MNITVTRVVQELPDGIDRLVAASRVEGVRNVEMLVADWRSGAQRFDTGGAALFCANVGGTLAGIGGITQQDGLDFPAMRVRRFYVHPDSRRHGIAAALAQACMTHGLATCSTLTCNAQASDAASVFWEAMGFERADLPTITHMYRHQ